MSGPTVHAQVGLAEATISLTVRGKEVSRSHPVVESSHGRNPPGGGRTGAGAGVMWGLKSDNEISITFRSWRLGTRTSILRAQYSRRPGASPANISSMRIISALLLLITTRPFPRRSEERRPWKPRTRRSKAIQWLAKSRRASTGLTRAQPRRPMSSTGRRARLFKSGDLVNQSCRAISVRQDSTRLNSVAEAAL